MEKLLSPPFHWEPLPLAANGVKKDSCTDRQKDKGGHLEEGPWARYFFTSSSRGCRGYPGGPVVKNLPANVGDTGSIPSSGRFPHALQGDETHAPQLLSPHTNKRSHCNEKPATGE